MDNNNYEKGEIEDEIIENQAEINPRKKRESSLKTSNNKPKGYISVRQDLYTADVLPCDASEARPTSNKIIYRNQAPYYKPSDLDSSWRDVKISDVRSLASEPNIPNKNIGKVDTMFHSMMKKNTDDSYEERKRRIQIYDTSDDEKLEEERQRRNREKCKRYRVKKKNRVAVQPISGSSDSDQKKREEERKQKNREKTKRCREKKKNEDAAVSISGPFDSDENVREEERKQKNREKARRYRDKKNNEIAAVSLNDPFDSDEKERKEKRKRQNKERARRYRENKNKKNEVEVAALSMATAEYSSSDSSGTKMEQARHTQINAE